MSISIIFVNYYTEDYIWIAIDSLYSHLKYLDFEIIVVNNSKTSGIDKLQNFLKYPNFRIIENDNNGFSSGCNVGAAHSKSKYLLFLNPDIKIFDNSITDLIQFHESNQNAGITSGLLRYEDSSLQYCFNYFPSVKWELFHLLGFGYKSEIQKLLSRIEIKKGKPFEVDWFHGAFMLICRTDFENVGGFNEDYFLYYEDVEICYKVKNILGKKNICFPNTSIFHDERSTVKGNVLDNIYFFHIHRSKLIFIDNYKFWKRNTIKYISLLTIISRIFILPIWKKYNGNKLKKLKQLLKIVRLYFDKSFLENCKFEFINK